MELHYIPTHKVLDVLSTTTPLESVIIWMDLMVSMQDKCVAPVVEVSWKEKPLEVALKEKPMENGLALMDPLVPGMPQPQMETLGYLKTAQQLEHGTMTPTVSSLVLG